MPCEQGAVGETGSQGLQGDTGVQGTQGDTGEQGIQGDTGAQGLQGDTGVQGETGLEGIGGYGTPYYPDDIDSTETGVLGLYEILRRTPSQMPEDTDAVTVSNANGATGLPFGAGYITDAGDPGKTSIPAGTWNFNVWAVADSVLAGRQPKIYCEMVQRATDGTETSLFVTTHQLITTTLAQYAIAYTQALPITLDVTDRLILRIWGEQNATAGAAIITYYYAGTAHATYITSPIGKGDKGETGAVGPQGETGEQGVQGDTGEQGIQGDTGAQGIQGDTGEQGVQGDTGVAGVQGDTGAQGIQGDTGEQGVQGDTGAIGETGAQGDTGIDGLQGETGTDGLQGDTGAEGLQGETGAEGGQGETGAEGAVGQTGAQGQTGAEGAVGATGAQGATGVQGETGAGADGAAGETGAQGETGTEGTATLPIAFTFAGNLGWTGVPVDWSDAYTQQSSVQIGGATGFYYFLGAETGAKGTLIVSYSANETPKFTGIQWANATEPSWSAYTGVDDIVSVVYNGDEYKGAATLGHAY